MMITFAFTPTAEKALRLFRVEPPVADVIEFFLAGDVEGGGFSSN